jgi:hypothetical protein
MKSEAKSYCVNDIFGQEPEPPMPEFTKM